MSYLDTCLRLTFTESQDPRGPRPVRVPGPVLVQAAGRVPHIAHLGILTLYTTNIFFDSKILKCPHLLDEDEAAAGAGGGEGGHSHEPEVGRGAEPAEGGETRRHHHHPLALAVMVT